MRVDGRPAGRKESGGLRPGPEARFLLETSGRAQYIGRRKGGVPVDADELRERFGGKHVARRGDEVLASADTMGELFALLKDRGIDSTDVVVEFVRPKGVTYAL